MSICSNYLWWLLPEFLKPDDPDRNRTTRGIVSAAGAELDDVRDLLQAVRDAILAARSSGQQLDLHGMERGGTVRLLDEDDDLFRERVMAARGDWMEFGRPADLVTLLEGFKFAASIIEPAAGDLLDCTAWSRFRVRLALTDDPPGVSQQEVYLQVNRRRPAHTRALYRAADIGMPFLRMDGVWTFNGEKRLPEWRMTS